jgi:hypothetical protein
MVAYGILRWIDGLDGHRKGGPAWNVGHVAFFAAIVLFAVLAVGLRRSVVADAPGRGMLAGVAAGAVLVGAACFLWVIAGDLSGAFRDAAPLPGVLAAAGPALFQAGLLTLLVLLVVARRLPVWSPVLVLVGFVGIAASLDLLPVASLAVAAGLAPLVVRAGAIPARGRS